IDVVVAVGGDGTMHECAKGVLGSNTALAVLPCGSGNGFALHFKMESELEKAIIQLNSCEFRAIDSCTANGMPFFNVSGVGFDAHIANLFATTKVRGFMTYVKLVLRECAFYPAQQYTLEYDGKTETHKAVIISWVNATQFGNNAQISPESKVDDGLVDICILKDFNRLKVPLLLYRLFTERIQHSKYMKIIRTKSVKISCQNGISHLDGEGVDLGSSILINTVPKSLNIFVPHG
ncbi:MAG: diacylglycerol kinase family protein, partial [Flavobacteriales bacterium]|nr:diacylglycerol kinase family protein [Flavobacteriales bacterium]